MEGDGSLRWLGISVVGWLAGVSACALLWRGQTSWLTFGLLVLLGATSLLHVVRFQSRVWLAALGMLLSASLALVGLVGYWNMGRPLDLLARGEAARTRGDDDEAIMLYTAALAARPVFVDALLGRAQAYARQGNPDRAIADLVCAERA